MVGILLTISPTHQNMKMSHRLRDVKKAERQKICDVLMHCMDKTRTKRNVKCGISLMKYESKYLLNVNDIHTHTHAYIRRWYARTVSLCLMQTENEKTTTYLLLLLVRGLNITNIKQQMLFCRMQYKRFPLSLFLTHTLTESCLFSVFFRRHVSCEPQRYRLEFKFWRYYESRPQKTCQFVKSLSMGLKYIRKEEQTTMKFENHNMNGWTMLLHARMHRHRQAYHRA